MKARHRIPLWLLVFLTFVTAGGLQALSVEWTRPLASYDEAAHIDYAVQLSEGHIPTWDDVYTEHSVALATCLEERSPDVKCMRTRMWIPQNRWPNGHSYEAQQAPLSYLPYAAAFAFAIGDFDDHFTQVRKVRFVNGLLWLLLAAAWSALILQVTTRTVPALASTIIVAVNPLVFDAFTYVNNDAMALITATATSAWFLGMLRTNARGSLPWLVAASLALGLATGLAKATALIVLVALALAVFASARFGHRRAAPRRWWFLLAASALFGGIVGWGYQLLVDARSTLGFTDVFASILPASPVGMATDATLRLPDVTEMVTGSGARTDPSYLFIEGGMTTPSALLLAFTLLAAATIAVGLALRGERFTRLPQLDPAAVGLAAIAAGGLLLVTLPLLWSVQGGFITHVNIGRYLGVLVPLFAITALATFQRFRRWGIATIVAGLIVALFSGPTEIISANIDWLVG